MLLLRRLWNSRRGFIEHPLDAGVPCPRTTPAAPGSRDDVRCRGKLHPNSGSNDRQGLNWPVSAPCVPCEGRRFPPGAGCSQQRIANGQGGHQSMPRHSSQTMKPDRTSVHASGAARDVMQSMSAPVGLWNGRRSKSPSPDYSWTGQLHLQDLIRNGIATILSRTPRKLASTR